MIRIASSAAAKTLEALESYLTHHNITTRDLDSAALSTIRSFGCIPGCLNYHGYPNSICASVNEEVVHCIPSGRQIFTGDKVTIDLATIYKGYYADTAKTYLVGNVSPELKAFVDVGYQALIEGIKQVKPGNHVADISNTMFDYVCSRGYGMVTSLCGHGIGTDMHEDPQIPNARMDTPGQELLPGMVICLEPILTMHWTGGIKKVGEWNIVSETGTRACHFEHTILVTETGHEVLTKRREESIE